MSNFELDPPKTLDDVLADGAWHPVMSALSIRRGQPTSFWVSEAPEAPFEAREDHSQAACFLVQNFISTSWAREGWDLGAKGEADNLTREEGVYLLAIDEGAYLRLNIPAEKAQPEESKGLVIIHPSDPLPF